MNAPKVVVAKKGFADGESRPLSGRIGGRVIHALVVNKGGRYYAYLNLCRHLPIALDLEDHQFFNHEKTMLQCHMHGALYQIESGLCVEGPCVGESLIPLEVVEEETRLVITLKDSKRL